MTARSASGRVGGLRRVLIIFPLLSLLAATPVASPSTDCATIPAAAGNMAMRLTVEHRRNMDILHIEGRIAADLPQRIETLFATQRRIGEIWFNSTGGDLQAAIDAGRFIRANEIYLTRVPAGAACIDACGILFLSGRIRSVHPNSIFDVAYLPSSDDRASDIDLQDAKITAAREADAISEYLIKMGVSRRLLSDVVIRQPAADGSTPLRCMTQREIRRYNVANSNE